MISGENSRRLDDSAVPTRRRRKKRLTPTNHYELHVFLILRRSQSNQIRRNHTRHPSRKQIISARLTSRVHISYKDSQAGGGALLLTSLPAMLIPEAPSPCLWQLPRERKTRRRGRRCGVFLQVAHAEAIRLGHPPKALLAHLSFHISPIPTMCSRETARRELTGWKKKEKKGKVK